MSLPDSIKCEYPVPDPEMQGAFWWCENIGWQCGQLFTITGDGRLVGSGGTCHDDENGDFNFTGNLKLYAHSTSGELFFYLAYFRNGRLQSLKRPSLIAFDVAADHPLWPATIYYCEHLQPQNGTIFRITGEGRLVRTNGSEAEDTHFHGGLIFYPGMTGGGRDDQYIAHFDRGQIQSLERIKEGSQIKETLKIFSQNRVPATLENESEKPENAAGAGAHNKFPTENEKTFRLLKMKLTERSPHYRLYGDYDYRGNIPFEEMLRIYSGQFFYLVVPQQWFQNNRLTESGKDKIYNAVFGNLWNPLFIDGNYNFLVKTSEGERLFDIEINQVEPETIRTTDLWQFYIFQEDFSYKTVALAEFNDFCGKERFISQKSRFHAVVVSINTPWVERQAASFLVEYLRGEHITVVEKEEISNDSDELIETLKKYINQPDVNLIITVGGTGQKDGGLVLEATRRVIEKELPAICEGIRSKLFQQRSFDRQFRGTGGIGGKALVVNLPETRKHIMKCYAVLAPIFTRFSGSITNTKIQNFTASDLESE